MLNPELSKEADDLEKLAEQCLMTARKLKSYLAENGHPQPTFHQDGPASWPEMGPDALQARMDLRNASKSLFELATGPEEMLGQGQSSALMDINAFRYAYRYKLSHAVPFNEMISYHDLASATGTDSEQLKQMLRQLMTIHVFCEPKPGFVAHTAASKALQHWGIDGYVGWTIYDCVPFVAHQVDAIEEWGHGSQANNQCAVQKAYNTDKAMFQALEDRPETRARFAQLMTFVSAKYVTSIDHLVSYDWAGMGESTVVDIGGNVGHCSTYIANANPKAKCVVQDLPHVIERAKNPETSVIPDNLRGRVSFMVHNFYDEQPIKGARVYFLRMILHLFSDKICRTVLQQLIPAMKPGYSKIVIVEQVMLPVGTLPLVAERSARTLDLLMMLLNNSKERDYDQWTSVLASVDSRLKIKQVLRTKESLLQIIEVDFEASTSTDKHN